jgi:hypothetical protein
VEGQPWQTDFPPEMQKTIGAIHPQELPTVFSIAPALLDWE